MALSRFQSCYDVYSKYVTSNVELVGEVEAALKWMSYFVAGRSAMSPIISELMYSASNILVLINDNIITNAVKVNKDLGRPNRYLRMILTLIEYLEVFAEISSLRAWGVRGKWMIVVLIQICKTAIRLFLVIRCGSGMLHSPPFPQMNTRQRKEAFQNLKRAFNNNSSNPNANAECVEKEVPPKSAHSNIQMGFTLKRSGRTVRTVTSSPPVFGRSWRVPTSESGFGTTERNSNLTPTDLDRTRRWAEILHISRPLCHLLSLYAFGAQSWLPWLMAGGMDATSLHLFGDTHSLNVSERGEMRFRTMATLYYLLRSPFYDALTKEQATRILGGMANTIPGFKYLANPILDYLPSWQKVYFYNWSC